MLIDAENELERANIAAVAQHMDALMRVPTIVAGAVMPDACPPARRTGRSRSAALWHARMRSIRDFIRRTSAARSPLPCLPARMIPKRILDAVQDVTHFGPGGRDAHSYAAGRDYVEVRLATLLEGNCRGSRIGHFATQGDGNHFAYVGHLKSTGHAALVTHHGSRGLGAQLYKRGMAVARKHTAIHAPKIPAIMPGSRRKRRTAAPTGRRCRSCASGPRPTTMRSTT